MMYMYPPYYNMWSDPHMPPYQYQPWPYAEYHACSNPPPYYGTCHYPPPPPHGHGMPYPPAAYSFPFPPQHYYYSYSVEQPRYEYDKNNPHYHCCGCNHHQDDHKQESQAADNKTNESQSSFKEPPHYPIMCDCTGSKANQYSPTPVLVNHPEQPSKQQAGNKTSDSLVPLLSKDHPDYPIVWLPRAYIESKANDKDECSHEPLPLKHLEPSKQGGNGDAVRDEEGVDGNQFPFKVFWLPSKIEQMGKGTRENNLDLVANNEASGTENEKTVKKNVGEHETSSKHAAQKVFPVKQVSTNEETGGKHAVQKVIPVKQVSTNEEKYILKSIDTNSDSVEKTDNGSRASPKTSKLPPVCLRIDPLPRKKKSSRSPSPGEKERSNGSVVNGPKSSQEQQSQVLKKSKEELSEGSIKAVDHVNKVEQANLANRATKVERANHGDVPREIGDESEKRKVEEKKNMSEHEAALVIQSVCRGFEVRKSQPLKKLRQIDEVRKSVSELRNRIHDLETSSSTIGLDNKNAVIIGETIMGLLLKLDTIQGLHPFVREVRKSVAKELVGLQEKLDYLVKSETPSEGTNCSPQQVMHPEDDGKLDQAHAQTGLCENNEHNVEQQLEKSTEDDSIQDNFDQAPTESDTVICENHEVEAKELQERCNTIGEPQLESYKEKINQAPTECNEALGLCENHEVETSESQEGCNTIGEPQLGSDKEKFDQTPTECDEALGLCENHGVRATESQEGCNIVGEPSHDEKFDPAPTECNEALGFHKESDEVEATDSQEGCNTICELQLDSHKEKLDQAPTECDEALGLHKENHEVEATESQEGCNSGDELQLESQKDQLPPECDEALRLHKENNEVEATESHEGCNTVGESHKEKADQEASECEVEARDDGDDIKLEDGIEEVNKKQLEREDLVNVESMMHDSGADNKNVVGSGDVQMEKANEGNGRLMEENEKLRTAVEELMKAGNDQLGVIRELTVRVKDLEKKLSKKKKKKVKVNKGRRVRDCVV